ERFTAMLAARPLDATFAAVRGLSRAQGSKAKPKSSQAVSPCRPNPGTAAASSESAASKEAAKARLSTARSAPAVGEAKLEPKTAKPKAAKAKAKNPETFDENLLPIPHGLTCVICRELFKDPVFTDDGHSYCRACITGWFQAHDAKVRDFYSVPSNIAPYSRKVVPALLAPMTQLQLSSRQLQPNIALKQAVEAFCEGRPLDERRERERQKLKRACEEQKAMEGELKSNFSKEIQAMKGQVQQLEDQLGQAKNELNAAQEKAKAADTGCRSFLSLELEELERDLADQSAEELGFMHLPYATELPAERPRFGRPRSQSA
ncbi:unnamed protein product, partial [Effrenium voratum]